MNNSEGKSDILQSFVNQLRLSSIKLIETIAESTRPTTVSSSASAFDDVKDEQFVETDKIIQSSSFSNSGLGHEKFFYTTRIVTDAVCLCLARSAHQDKFYWSQSLRTTDDILLLSGYKDTSSLASDATKIKSFFCNKDRVLWATRSIDREPDQCDLDSLARIYESYMSTVAVLCSKLIRQLTIMENLCLQLVRSLDISFDLTTLGNVHFFILTNAISLAYDHNDEAQVDYLNYKQDEISKSLFEALLTFHKLSRLLSIYNVSSLASTPHSYFIHSSLYDVCQYLFGAESMHLFARRESSKCIAPLLTLISVAPTSIAHHFVLKGFGMADDVYQACSLLRKVNYFKLNYYTLCD